MSPADFDHLSASVLALFPRLSEAEQRMSLALYRLLAGGEAVAANVLAAAAGVRPEEVERVLARWPGVQRAAVGTVTGYWGLTITPTRHRVQIGGRVVYAWCAWDTLFLPGVLAQSAYVQSNCPVSGKRIDLELKPTGIARVAGRVSVSFIVPDRRKASENIVNNFCRFIHFFSAPEAGEQWVSQHPGTVLATLDEAWELGCRRNALLYTEGDTR
jgi:alkylmercury lyase